jgi:hypothetical protein
MINLMTTVLHDTTRVRVPVVGIQANRKRTSRKNIVGHVALAIDGGVSVHRNNILARFRMALSSHTVGRSVRII